MEANFEFFVIFAANKSVSKFAGSPICSHAGTVSQLCCLVMYCVVGVPAAMHRHSGHPHLGLWPLLLYKGNCRECSWRVSRLWGLEGAVQSLPFACSVHSCNSSSTNSFAVQQFIISNYNGIIRVAAQRRAASSTMLLLQPMEHCMAPTIKQSADMR